MGGEVTLTPTRPPLPSPVAAAGRRFTGSPDMTDLRLTNISLSYRQRRRPVTPVLEHVSLSLAPGEFVAVIGRSGSGKTSLLNLAAGFIAPTEGRVTRSGKAVTGPGADRAVVFQDDALY